MNSLLDHDERAILEAWSAMTGARVAQRAQIVLMAVQGSTSAEIARAMACSERLVTRWLSRFAAGGLASLLDSPRPGRPVDGARHAHIDRYLTQAASSRKVPGVVEFSRGQDLSMHMVWRAARRNAQTLARARRLQIPVELDAAVASSGLVGLFFDDAIVVAAFARPRAVTRPVKRGLWDQPPAHITAHYRSRRISPSRAVGLVNCLTAAAKGVDGDDGGGNGAAMHPVFALAWERWQARVLAGARARGAITLLVSGRVASTAFIRCLSDLRDASEAAAGDGNVRRRELILLATPDRWKRAVLSRIAGDAGGRLGRAIAPWVNAIQAAPRFRWAA